jgi:hypothetical protein
MMLVLISILVVIVMISIATVAARLLQKHPPVDPQKAWKEVEEFKKRAMKITVAFRECEVLSNSYQEDQLKHTGYRVQALDSLYGDGLSNVARVTINQSQIVFKTLIGATEKIFVSVPIAMERVTLLLKLDAQQETTLYLAPDNSGRYYFDLEFLMKEA